MKTELKEVIHPVYKDDAKIIFRTEDLFYPEYKGSYFVLIKSDGYGYFEQMKKLYTRGEILDRFNIVIDSGKIEQAPEK